MGPPGADQHLAGSSRAVGRDPTGRGMLTARRPWTDGDPLARWARAEPMKIRGIRVTHLGKVLPGSPHLAARRHDRPFSGRLAVLEPPPARDFWHKLLAYRGPR
jgi:hypothetical protein